MSILPEQSTRRASTDAPILDILQDRWSTRAFDDSEVLSDADLASILEAARWSPSASNSQPWRFVVGRRGGEEFRAIQASLAKRNAEWAPAAAVLVVAFGDTRAGGREQSHAMYDTGQAVAHLTIQAHSMGYFVHQMGGFDPDSLRERYASLGDGNLEPYTVIALGSRADLRLLPDWAAEREVADRVRIPVTEFVIAVDEATAVEH